MELRQTPIFFLKLTKDYVVKKVIGVIGAGYGDEGKGKTVSYLCEQHKHEKTIVVRFNGGAQAAHNVILKDGTHHTFAHFGSGTLQGVPTYLNDQFIVNPMLYIEEYEKLITKTTIRPKLFFNSDCRVSTPYDMLYNLAVERSRGVNKHGSCGVGIFTTINRYEDMSDSPKIHQLFKNSDLIFPYLDYVKAYYIDKMKGLNHSQEYIDLMKNTDVRGSFFDAVNLMEQECQLADDDDIITPFDTFIFEGAQGLLLKEGFGVFPYLTPSDSGATEIVKFTNKVDTLSSNCSFQLNYVSRIYTTRHGAGPLAQECTADELGLCTKDEKNVTNSNQDHFRYAPLQPSVLINTIQTDLRDSMKNMGGNIRLDPLVVIINGFDQLKDSDEIIDNIFIEMGTKYMSGIILCGFGPKSDDMIVLNQNEFKKPGKMLKESLKIKI